MACIGWSFSVDKGSYAQGRGRHSYSNIMLGWLLHKASCLSYGQWELQLTQKVGQKAESRTYLPEVANECSLVGQSQFCNWVSWVQFFLQPDPGTFVVPLTDSSNPYIADTNLGEAAGLLQNECSLIVCLNTALLQHDKLWGKWLYSLLLFLTFYDITIARYTSILGRRCELIIAGKIWKVPQWILTVVSTAVQQNDLLELPNTSSRTCLNSAIL
jgi:hypothetical protein